MSSYVYMKVLESAPERYDRGIRWLSGGDIDALYATVAARVAEPGARVLDLGCGTGGLSLACARRGARVVGVDINPGMLDVARAKLDDAELTGSVELVELGVMELEDQLESDSFDAATACLLFSELLPEEQAYTLRTLHRLVRPGGRVVIADELAAASWRGLWRRARRLPLAIVTYLLTHTGTKPVADLSRTLAEAGFVDISVERDAPADVSIFCARREELAA